MANSEYWGIILDIVTVCKRMWQKGWVANHDGNITARMDNKLLATPTAISKVDISPEIILTLDMDGKKIAGPGKPFSEISLHLALYHERPDVTAIVHAHPSYATARGACGLSLNKPFIPEAVVSLGDVIPVIPYGTSDLSTAFHESNAWMIQGNGVLAAGTDVMQAYLRIELVEHLAKMDFIANHLDKPFEIPREDIVKLLEKRSSASLEPPRQGWSRGSSSTLPKATARETEPAVTGPPPDDNAIRQIIAEEIKSILGD